MEKDLQAIVDEATQKLDSITNRPDWDKVKATILGPNGSLTQLGKGIGKLAKEDRPIFGPFSVKLGSLLPKLQKQKPNGFALMP